MGYERFRGGVVERVGERRVDAALMALVRHHAATEEDRETILAFCAEPVRGFQLDLLLRHVGLRLPLLADDIVVDQWRIAGPGGREDPVITARMAMTHGGLDWNPVGLRHEGSTVPDAVAEAMAGRPLGDLVEHPYLPTDLVVSRLHAGASGWHAEFAVEDRADDDVSLEMSAGSLR